MSCLFWRLSLSFTEDDMNMKEKVLLLLSLMKRMPSGLFDSKAAAKLKAELAEFDAASGAEKPAEAADVAYYVTKLLCYLASINDRNCAHWTVLFWEAVGDPAACQALFDRARSSGYEFMVIAMEEAMRSVSHVESVLGVPPGTSLDLAIAKYSLRARPGNPKDHAAEMAACQEVINGAKR